MVVFIVINRFTREATLTQQPDSMRNQYNTDDADVTIVKGYNNTSNYNQINTNNYSNQTVDDQNNNVNYYYNQNQQDFNSINSYNNNDKPSSSFMPITPHGVPSSAAPLWRNENKNNNNINNNNNYY